MRQGGLEDLAFRRPIMYQHQLEAISDWLDHSDKPHHWLRVRHMTWHLGHRGELIVDRLKEG